METKEVIKKHKLKLQLEVVFERPYSFMGKINYAFFTELCKTNSLTIAVDIGILLQFNLPVLCYWDRRVT